MPHWLIKSATQRALSLLPRAEVWNEILQKYVTRSLDFRPAEFDSRLTFCRRHLEHLISFEPQRAAGFRYLELGTGWYPTTPTGLYLCGASEGWTIDIRPLLRPERVRQTFQHFLDSAESGRLWQMLPQAQPARLETLRNAVSSAETTVCGLLERLGIHYLVRDARDTGLASGSVDLVFSNTSLEYIPAPILAGILTEFRRISSAGSISSHRIVLMDQFCHFDDNITEFNFLRYTDRQWRWLESPLTRHSRLRISDYRRLFSAAGFEIVSEDNLLGSADQLSRVPLAPEFRNYSQGDLLVIESFVAARPR